MVCICKHKDGDFAWVCMHCCKCNECCEGDGNCKELTDEELEKIVKEFPDGRE